MESKPSKVLDACCGSKMFWFDKHDDRATYVDSRHISSCEFSPGRSLEVAPDIQCDFRHLPFPDESFWHIVFDPPHLRRVGPKSWARAKYGALEETWPTMLHDGFLECWRVLKTNGTLIFKWSSVQIPLADILKVIPKRPLYGHRSGKHMGTHWIAFIKCSDERDDKPMAELL